ncbi:1083_t:CDS:2, partial [Funneliformis mosseae]
DCYLGLAKISAAIKKLPLQQYSSFKQDCFDIINSRLEEYDDDLYILSYFLLPQFRGAGFKNGQFIRIVKVAVEIWKQMGKSLLSANIL